MKDKFGCKKAVVVIVWFGDKVMLTKRIGTATFKDWWAAAGGSVEHKDLSLNHAAQREVQEETGMFFHPSEIEIVDFYQEGIFKAFIFHAYRDDYLFKDIKNTEPKKHSPWELFTPQEALKLPKLMPALEEYLKKHLTNVSIKR